MVLPGSSIADLSDQFIKVMATGKTSGFIQANVVLILISIIVVAILKFLVSILEPSNYKLDMTAKEYCKPLAEIDNTLRFKRGVDGEYHASSSSSSISPGNKYSIGINHDRPSSVHLNNDSHYLSTRGNNGASEGGSCIGESNGTLSGSVNHVYPNGWIPIVESHKVKPGTIKKAIIFGRDLIVTRSSDGQKVNVLDAYCPHMGVHIGIGGQVKRVENESCIECPFHGWTFRASDGQCVSIPYQKNSSKCNIPRKAKLGTWDCVEVDNFIYVWHHIDNQQPNWHLVPADELLANEWQLAGRSCHRTNLELRDMHENGADMNHFEGIHNDLFILGNHITKIRPLNFLQKYTRHHWLPEWRPMLDGVGKLTHMAEMKLQSWISFFNLRLFDITVHANQIGPARVNLRYDSKWYGKGLLIMNAIPLGGRQTKYIQHIYTKRTLFQCFMAKWVLYGEIKMLERDFFIWNHKKNMRNPIFVPEDRTQKQFRLWYSQFYKRKQIVVRVQDNSNMTYGENRGIKVCKSDDFDF